MTPDLSYQYRNERERKRVNIFYEIGNIYTTIDLICIQYQIVAINLVVARYLSCFVIIFVVPSYFNYCRGDRLQNSDFFSIHSLLLLYCSE